MQAFLKNGGGFSSSKKNVTTKDGAASSSKSGKSRAIPWVEKYRPKNVDEVAYQEEVVAVLKKALQGADLPNLLFYGPPGTGKTSTILAVARELFGADMYRSRILELNASDERGIQVIRDKVKKFAQLSASSIRTDGKPCPPFKIVILDEADSMTSSAQSALRRTMEKESKTNRFCLICNYVSRIIEPLTSRCSKFRYKPLSTDTLEKRLKFICVEENVKCSDEVIAVLIDVSEGDLRKAITYLQSAYRLQDEEITTDLIYNIAGVVPKSYIDDIIKICYSDSYEKLEQFVTNFVANGFSATQLIMQMHDIIVTKEDLSDQQKSVICNQLAIVDKCLVDGADEYLQIMDLCTCIMNQLCHH